MTAELTFGDLLHVSLGRIDQAARVLAKTERYGERPTMGQDLVGNIDWCLSGRFIRPGVYFDGVICGVLGSWF
ncbi:hypothetical protein E1287_31360 [Actinomadura sp. KC06]|uniref:hypothetical protein n=1 Tax=Actinomadura sp. KC06 TaxID=2530369 RepID=UPI00105119B0|nr:hypothetical protein [Actinomadura sp. KC06]TDD29255.1 hypothetical protein E1287_31360 [Actinomadura sp. KC06]